MKKLSFVLLGSLAAAQIAQAAPGSFNGFYVGGQLGLTQRNHKVNTDDSFSKYARDALSKNRKVNGMTYGLYTGYGQNNNGFYWGGEFGIEHSTANKRLNCDYETPRDVMIGRRVVRTEQIKTEMSYTYRRGVVFSLTPRLGAVIATDHLIYAKLGMELSRDTVRAVTNGVEKNQSKRNLVFVPGLGYEHAFGKVLGRVEYGYNMGGKVKFRDATVKYSAHVLKVGVAYKF